MVRSVVAVAILAAVAGPAAGQVPASAASGVGSFGGGTPSRPTATRYGGPRPGGYVVRQARPKPPPFGPFVPIAPWWFGPFGGYYPWVWDSPWGGGYVPVAPPAPPPAAAPPARVVELSGQGSARLTAEFPAPAEVRLDGVAQPGGPRREWVFDSPVLRPGQTYTFRVAARWQLDGTTYERDREVSAGPGDRRRLTVLSGTPVPAGR